MFPDARPSGNGWRTRAAVFLPYAVEVQESVFAIHRQRSLSANALEKPKQKPNKNRDAGTFFCLLVLAADIGGSMGHVTIPLSQVVPASAGVPAAAFRRSVYVV